MSRIANDTAKVSLPESWTNVINKPELDEVENRLQENITNGDTTLQNNLDTVESTLKESITTVDTAAKKSITAEKKRAEKKETELQNKFNSYTPTIDVPGIKVDNAVHADNADNAANADNATNDANGKNIDTTYAKIANTYNKEEVDQKVSSVYTYKGSVATKAKLPTQDLTIGDVYDVKDSGINYAWNGTSWDALGMEIDLTLYAKKTDVPEIKVNNAVQADKVADNATNASGEEIAIAKKTPSISPDTLFTAKEPLDKLLENGTYRGKGGSPYNDNITWKVIVSVDQNSVTQKPEWVAQFIYAPATDLPFYYRLTSNCGKTWTSWFEINTTKNTLSGAPSLGLPELDFNKANRAGSYFLGVVVKDLKNAPDFLDLNSYLIGTLDVIGTNQDWLIQIIKTGYPDARIYIRQLDTYGETVATKWKQIATTEDIADTTPVATIIYSAAKTAPTGFLLCDGREITPQQYPRLYAVIGTDFDPNHAKCLLPNQLTADGKPRALYGADNRTYKVGTYIEESLPTHTHSLLSVDDGYFGQTYGLFSPDIATQGGISAVNGATAPTYPNMYGEKNIPSGKNYVSQNETEVWKNDANVFSNGIAVNMYIKY